MIPAECDTSATIARNRTRSVGTGHFLGIALKFFSAAGADVWALLKNRREEESGPPDSRRPCHFVQNRGRRCLIPPQAVAPAPVLQPQQPLPRPPSRAPRE